MGSFDITLRDAIQEILPKFIQILTGKSATKLLDTSLPEVKDRRVDFLVELEDGRIFHLELQTTNDKNMPFRMLEYYTLISQKYPSKDILQMVLYLGEKPLKMKNKIQKENIKFNYILKDIKDIKCEELLESEDLTDKILAVLCNVENPSKYFREILTELSKLPERERRDYLKKLLNLLSYRPKLMIEFKKEEDKMPLTIDRETMEKHPLYKDGKLEGIREGKLEAKKEDIIKLHKKTGWDSNKIADILELPVNFVKNVLKEEK